MTSEDAVVVWGAGAIGGTIGASLAASGRDVLFVDRVEEHVAAIAARGLEIEGPVARFRAAARAVTPERMTGRHRLVLLAVKAHHTGEAVRMLRPFLAEDGVVVSCQNGLNEIEIAEAIGRDRTIGAFVNFGADYLAPGRIMFGNRGAVVVGELDGGATGRIASIHALLRIFEPNAVLTGSIFGYLWGKAAYGAILKASALSNDRDRRLHRRFGAARDHPPPGPGGAGGGRGGRRAADRLRRLRPGRLHASRPGAAHAVFRRDDQAQPQLGQDA